MEILRYPDPRLTAPNAPLVAFGPEEQSKVAEMFALMARTGGVGLAAPQVGWNVRLFVLAAPDASRRNRRLVVWNPSFEGTGPRLRMGEGCLSFPGAWATVERWSEVLLRGLTPDGPVEERADGMFAQAVQHEADHIDGILLLDRMTPADRRAHAGLVAHLEADFRRKKQT